MVSTEQSPTLDTPITLTADTLYQLAGHASIEPVDMFWAPHVMSAAKPALAGYATAPVAALASLNDHAGNFGHTLFDFLFPVGCCPASVSCSHQLCG